MPEGHTLHRLATAVREHFAGRTVSVTSPQGRFAESARLVDGTELVTSESWGKHLFVEFEQERFVHVHLGLYGKFDLYDGPPPPPVGQVRCASWRARPVRRTETCAVPRPATC